MNHTEIADTYDDAADYIEEHGWQQFSIGDDGGPRCTVGVLRSVLKTPSHLSLPVPVRAAFREHVGCRFILGWNDEKGRTVTQVLDALRGAAKAEREAADVEDATRTRNGWVVA